MEQNRAIEDPHVRRVYDDLTALQSELQDKVERKRRLVGVYQAAMEKGDLASALLALKMMDGPSRD